MLGPDQENRHLRALDLVVRAVEADAAPEGDAGVLDRLDVVPERGGGVRHVEEGVVVGLGADLVGLAERRAARGVDAELAVHRRRRGRCGARSRRPWPTKWVITSLKSVSPTHCAPSLTTTDIPVIGRQVSPSWLLNGSCRSRSGSRATWPQQGEVQLGGVVEPSSQVAASSGTSLQGSLKITSLLGAKAVPPEQVVLRALDPA